MQLDHGFQENLTPERVDQILAAARNAAPKEPVKSPGTRRSR
jgi:hypothetical protein